MRSERPVGGRLGLLTTPSGRDPAPPARGAEGATSPEPLRHPGPDGTGVSGVAGPAPGRGDRGGGPAPDAPASRWLPLEAAMDFASRHIGPTPDHQQQMLAEVGYQSLAGLTAAALPPALASTGADGLRLPAPLSEAEALAALRRLAAQNTVLTSMIGLGYYPADTPAVIRRNVLENPGWYTAYTPYQPEISQGRLEALINFQTMIEDLTGLAVANASMLDEATAAAEAMMLCRRVAKNSSMTIHVAEDVLPQTIDVVRTRARPLGITVSVGPAQRALDIECFAALLQYPGA